MIRSVTRIPFPEVFNDLKDAGKDYEDSEQYDRYSK